MTRRARAREVALQLLFQHDYNDRIGRSLAEKFARARLHRNAELVAFCMLLFDGVQQHREAIDQRLGQAAENWRVARMAAVDRNVLRLGAFELMHMPETPTAVVINEAIELARRFGSADSPAFVNGVLDRLSRDRSGATTRPTDAADARA
jgi:N utilization substance protein B